MKTFRPAKGWKKEIEEISLGAVITILIIVGSSAVVLASTGAGGGSGMVMWSHVITPQLCVATPAGGVQPKPCQKAGDYLVIGTGNAPQLELTPAQARSLLKVPRPQGWIIGFMTPGAPPQATTFWMF